MDSRHEPVGGSRMDPAGHPGRNQPAERAESWGLAEAVRFELTGPCGPTVFKTVAIDHSATLPGVEAAIVATGPCALDEHVIWMTSQRGG